MEHDQIGYIVRYTKLKEKLLQINLIQEKKKLEIKQAELTNLEARYNVFLTHQREFKCKFFAFLITTKLATKRRLIEKLEKKRKDKIEALMSEISAIKAEITALQSKIDEMQAKLAKLKLKIEKYAHLIDIIDLEWC